eukprot:scaffold551_cov250-Pinguiococcus_pyrenoidosus.AAC.1
MYEVASDQITLTIYNDSDCETAINSTDPSPVSNTCDGAFRSRIMSYTFDEAPKGGGLWNIFYQDSTCSLPAVDYNFYGLQEDACLLGTRFHSCNGTFTEYTVFNGSKCTGVGDSLLGSVGVCIGVDPDNGFTFSYDDGEAYHDLDMGMLFCESLAAKGDGDDVCFAADSM